MRLGDGARVFVGNLCTAVEERAIQVQGDKLDGHGDYCTRLRITVTHRRAGLSVVRGKVKAPAVETQTKSELNKRGSCCG